MTLSNMSLSSPTSRSVSIDVCKITNKFRDCCKTRMGFFTHNNSKTKKKKLPCLLYRTNEQLNSFRFCVRLTFYYYIYNYIYNNKFLCTFSHTKLFNCSFVRLEATSSHFCTEKVDSHYREQLTSFLKWLTLFLRTLTPYGYCLLVILLSFLISVDPSCRWLFQFF